MTITGQALDLADDAAAPEPAQTPGDPASAAVDTAHRLDDIRHHLSHAAGRMKAARAATDPGIRDRHSQRLAGHLQQALDAGHDLTAGIRAHYPAEAAELEQVKGAVGLARAVSEDAKAATTAHLLETTFHELAHAARHAQAMTQGTPDAEWEFNADHAAKHLDGAAEHAGKLEQHLRDNYPDEAGWLEGLGEATAGAEGDGGKQHAAYGKDSGGTITAQMANGDTVSGQAIGLTGDGHGHHIAGSPMVYKHGFIPIDGTVLHSDGIRRPGKGKSVGKVAAREAPGIREQMRSPAAPKASPSDVIGQYKGWRDSLTGDEDKAMRFYQSPGFALMNGQLRGLDPEKLKSGEHASDADLKRARQASKILTAAIAKAPPLKQDTTVYRGFDAGQFGELKPGKVVMDKGFTSTSVTNDAGAVGRAGAAGQMELTLPAGTKAGAGSARELILPPGSQMRVTSVTRKGGVTHVKAELVPQGVSLAAAGSETLSVPMANGDTVTGELT